MGKEPFQNQQDQLSLLHAVGQEADTPEKFTAVQLFEPQTISARRHLGESRPPSSKSLMRASLQGGGALPCVAQQPAPGGDRARIVSAGYKALAIQLHPDKGGSREAMILLNEVRDLL